EQLEKGGEHFEPSSRGAERRGDLSPSKPTSEIAALPTVARNDGPDVPSTSPDVWKRFLAEIWKKPSVASQMERAQLKSATASEWVIGFLDAFAMASVQRNQGFLEETAAALAGEPVAMRFVQDSQDR